MTDPRHGAAQPPAPRSASPGRGALAVGAAGRRRGCAVGRGRRSATAAAARPARATRSTASTRPASSPRPRTGCTSPPSTSPPTPATSWSRCCGRGPPAAAQMTAGRSRSAATAADAVRRPADRHRRGDSACRAAGLTLTFGFGPTLFEKDGKDRFGLDGPAARRRCASCRTSRPTTSTPPAATATCASRPAPTTRRSRCTRSATWRGSASARPPMRWAQLGFGRTSSTSTAQATPRNLFGFKDGTANLKAEEAADRRRARLGRRRRRRRGRLAGRRLLPGGPPDQHAHRDLGPHLAARAGEPDRPRPGRRARRCRAARSSPSPTSTMQGRGGPLIAAGRPRPPRPPDAEQRRPDAAPRLQLHRRQRPRSAGSTPGCSSSPSSATRDTHYIPMQTELVLRATA